MTGRRLLACVLLLAGAAALWWLGHAEEYRLFALSADSGAVVWSAGLPSGTRMAGVPTVAEGRVVLGLGIRGPQTEDDDRWQLAAFDAATGRPLWEHLPPPEQGRRLQTVDLVTTTPHVVDDRVYVRLEGEDTSSLLALDATTGQPAWTLDTRLAFGHYSRHTDVVARNGRVLVPTTEGDGLLLRALDAKTGAELWRVPVEHEGVPRTDLGPYFAANDDTFYAGLSRGVLALDAASGAVRFRVDEEENARGGQIWLDGVTLYRRSSYQSIIALDAATGAQRWIYRLDTADGSLALRSFAVRDGVLAMLCTCANDDRRDWGRLITADAASGAERWRAPLDTLVGLYQSWPVVVAGVVVETTEHGDVVGRSATGGATRWRFARGSGLGVAADDRLVFASDRAPRWRHWLRILGLPVPA